MTIECHLLKERFIIRHLKVDLLTFKITSINLGIFQKLKSFHVLHLAKKVKIMS